MKRLSRLRGCCSYEGGQPCRAGGAGSCAARPWSATRARRACFTYETHKKTKRCKAAPNVRNEVALKVDPWSHSSRGMDGGRTGPGSPEPSTREIIGVKSYCSSFAQFLERRRSATTIDRNHARTHKLDEPVGAHVPSASRTAIGVPAAHPDNRSRNNV